MAVEWWSQQMAGLIGGLGGGGFGALGGILGAAAGILAPRGRGKPVIVGAMTSIVVIGVAALVSGIVAVTGGQPYHVWYPLVLIGGILTVVVGSLIPVVMLRYRQAEARRLDAEELRRG